jgi:signal transduction histidine kinase
MFGNDPKNELLHTIVHQLKTPINAARGCLELVQSLGPLNEKQTHFTERAIASLDRMNDLVARLLDLAWIESGTPLELTDLDLKTITHQIVDSLAEIAANREITIELELDDSLGLVRADAERITQVVDNLVGNAVKYNRDGGTVWVTAKGERDHVQVSVRDSGIGIPSEDVPQVFDRFFRSRLGVEQRIEGNGLGLTIVQAIIQEHQGQIWVESEEGVGTTFTFALPRRAQFSDGSDARIEDPDNTNEKRAGSAKFDAERSSEASDSVDDDLQESREGSEDDDSRDDDV